MCAVAFKWDGLARQTMALQQSIVHKSTNLNPFFPSVSIMVEGQGWVEPQNVYVNPLHPDSDPVWLLNTQLNYNWINLSFSWMVYHSAADWLHSWWMHLTECATCSIYTNLYCGKPTPPKQMECGLVVLFILHQGAFACCPAPFRFLVNTARTNWDAWPNKAIHISTVPVDSVGRFLRWTKGLLPTRDIAPFH